MALIIKEMKELSRDRLNVLLMFLIPVVNLFIMGYSINMDVREVPTVVVDKDKEFLSRTLIQGMNNTGYFDTLIVGSEQEAERLFVAGKAKLIIYLPDNFTHELITNKLPSIFVESDATDPIAIANAMNALDKLLKQVFNKDISRFSKLAQHDTPLVELIVRKNFNPYEVSKINIVPGLCGVILSIVPTLMVCLSMIKEREKGTLIHIINSAVNPIFIMFGKMIPYTLIGVMQGMVLLVLATVVIGIPMRGAATELLFICILFIILNVLIGLMFATLFDTQLQAIQVLSFYFLMSNLLSGFISPFAAMPDWSQSIGSLLPLTYFLHLVRGIMIKGYTLGQMSSDVVVMGAMIITFGLITYILFRRMVSKNYT